MQRNIRRFEAVDIGMASVETGTERFAKDDVYAGPAVSTWRCNLTALSQRYNLYFAAFRDGVAVYEPDFPFQKLKRKPKLYIPPSLAEPYAEGYIDNRRPHSINHLVVGDLGTEEILLLATDSGNVTAYHTRSIYDAVQKDPYKFSANGRSDYVGVRPFFTHWVCESAWGVAIHREGRMIAVSANQPYHYRDDDECAKVTVFAFALTEQEDGPDEEDEEDDRETPAQSEWHVWDPMINGGSTPTRDRNFKITLAGEQGHQTNIPSISFVNTNEDREGSWLISTDIRGGMRVWQIWRGSCFRTYDFEEASQFRRWPWRRDGGWLVAALDPAAFRPAANLEQFCGHYRAPSYKGHQGAMSESYDITNIVRLRTPGRSQRHPLVKEHSDDEDGQGDAEEAAEEWSSEEPDLSSRAEGSGFGFRHLTLEDDRPARTDQARSSLANMADNDMRDLSQAHPIELPVREHTVVNMDMDPGIEDILLDHYEQNAVDASSETGTDPEEEEAVDEASTAGSDDDETEDSSPNSASTASHSNRTQRTSVDIENGPELLSSPNASADGSRPSTNSTPSKRPRRTQNVTNMEDIRMPFIPTLHCSFSHLRLINVPRSRSPHLFCANLLNQDLPPELENAHESHLARLSMVQQIPELGLVIIASQLGRVAVCSLTRNVTTNTCGLRVDWILPTRTQERTKVRPYLPLLGIATSPIQGRQFSRPENDSDPHAWAEDRTIAGVDTTFDRRVLVLSPQPPIADSSDSDVDTSGKRRAPKRKKRRRSFSSRGSSNSSQASMEMRPWVKPESKEDWEAFEEGRRYRLMMTYVDMTVLTYELGRGVEREDVRDD